MLNLPVDHIEQEMKAQKSCDNCNFWNGEECLVVLHGSYCFEFNKWEEAVKDELIGKRVFDKEFGFGTVVEYVGREFYYLVRFDLPNPRLDNGKTSLDTYRGKYPNGTCRFYRKEYLQVLIDNHGPTLYAVQSKPADSNIVVTLPKRKPPTISTNI